jgi:hypothetical protein
MSARFLYSCLSDLRPSPISEPGIRRSKATCTSASRCQGGVSKPGRVFVGGDVHTPTRVVLGKTGHMTVLQALALAEGANPTANLHKAKIIRKSENGNTEVPVDINKIMQAKAPDVALQAGDILFVPHGAGKSWHKIENLYYDVPPSAPLRDAAPIYMR